MEKDQKSLAEPESLKHNYYNTLLIIVTRFY